MHRVKIPFSYRAHGDRPYQHFMGWCREHCAKAFECVSGSFVLPDEGTYTFGFESVDDARAFERTWAEGV